LETLFERLLELGELRLGDRLRAHDVGVGHAFHVVLETVENVADLRQQLDAARFEQHPDEVAPRGVELLAADGEKERLLLRVVEPRIVQRRAHPGIAGDAGSEPQHLRPHRQRVLLLRELEGGFRVWPGDGGELGHQSSCRIADSRSACALASTSRRRIFSAPATARSATWLRSTSLARTISCSSSPSFIALTFSASASASAFARSIVSFRCFSARVTISVARVFASL